MGSAAGFAVTLALTPVLSRIYSPAMFGTFSTIAAVVSIFVGFSTLRLEVLAQREPDDDRAHDLTSLALATSALAGLAGLIVTASLVVFRHWPSEWLLTGPLIAVASWPLVAIARYTRSGRFSALGWGNLAQGAGVGLIQVSLGLWRPSILGLAAGFGVARGVWLGAMSPNEWRSWRRWSPLWRTHRRAALWAGSSALVNSAAGQAVLLVTASSFGAAGAGVVAMALRVLVAPLSLVSQAVAAAGLGHVGAALRGGDPAAAQQLIRRAMRDLAVLGAIPCAAIVVVGPLALPIVLGQAWVEVGAVSAGLALGAWAQFVAAPFAQVLNLTGGSRQLLAWDVSRLAILILALTLPAHAGMGLAVTMWIYSGAQLLLYLVLVRLFLRSLSGFESSL